MYLIDVLEDFILWLISAISPTVGDQVEPFVILAAQPGRSGLLNSIAKKIGISFFPELVNLSIAGAGAAAVFALWSSASRDRGFNASRRPIPATSDTVKEKLGQSATSITESELSPIIADAEGRHPVEVSVFAPPESAPGGEFFIQVFLHDLKDIDAVQQVAEANEAEATMQAAVPLILPLQVKDKIRVSLEGDGAEIVGSPIQEFGWTTNLNYVAFAVRLPKRLGEKRYRPIIRVFVNDTPVATVRLDITAKKKAPLGSPASVINEARRFRSVFVSYSSQDRPEVLRAIQILKAMNVNVFADIISLVSGSNWENELTRAISQCDAFFLFWSTNAKNSEWVIREARLAIETQKKSPQDLPEIVPIILEGPPPVAPPDELAQIHFNDPIQSIYFAEKIARDTAVTR
jgi:TIR domain